jgi:glycine hydroxymethyltransferase
MNSNLTSADLEIYQLVQLESQRQELGLELIASENYCSKAVMEAQGSILTNKYAEGYPGKRYYNGCEVVDQIEALAISRLNKVFGSKFANVQPHSGSSANMAVYFSLLETGDKILGMDLSQGGHLTHGSPVNFSGKLFTTSFYGVNELTEVLDYDNIRDIAIKEKPKLIIAGASAYPRAIDFNKFRDIADEVGAYLMVDMAHIAGLVAAGLHENPVGIADVITSTTHKTLRGPRGGIILTNNEDINKKINSNIFPGIQGGPLEHVIAAKAVAFKEALSDEFKLYQQQVIINAKILADSLIAEGLAVVSNGTDNHLILAKTDSFNMSGKDASNYLEHIGITCNKNMVPGDKRSPFVTSGIRLGTPALTTRGFKEQEMKEVARFIITCLRNAGDSSIAKSLKQEIMEMCRALPVYSQENHTLQ